MNVLQKWLANATPQEKARLARLAKTTTGNLKQVAGAYRTNGKLSTTPELARKLEEGAVRIAREGLPELNREDLCTACGKCEFAKEARKARA